MNLVIDVDKTLLTTRRPGGLREWRRRVLACEFVPMYGAALGVRALLANVGTDESVYVLTTRSSELEAVTRTNVERFFPELVARATFSMSPGVDDDYDALACKGSRLQVIAARCGQVKLVDDDVKMRRFLRPGDAFVLAPDCWFSYCAAEVPGGR